MRMLVSFFKCNKPGLFSLATAFLQDPKNLQASHKPLEQWFQPWLHRKITWEAVNNVNAWILPPDSDRIGLGEAWTPEFLSPFLYPLVNSYPEM